MSLIDELICLDSLVNVFTAFAIFGRAFESDLPEWTCFILSFIYHYIALLNRMIPVGILAFRYIHVLKYSWVQNYGATRINKIILSMILLVPLLTCIFIFIER